MRPLLNCCLCLAMVGQFVSVKAQDSIENPLRFFPAETALVLRLKEPDKTKDSLTNFVNAIQPGAGQFMNQADEHLGQLISNPELTGVDQSRDWYVAVVLTGAGRPIPVFAIPSTDTAALVDAVDEQMNTTIQGDWVLYTEKPAELPASTGESITGLLNGPALELFQKSDVGAFINVAHLTATYADQIEDAKDQLSTTLTQLQSIESPPGVDMSAIMTMYSDLATYVFQALDDASHLTLTVDVNEAGIQFEDYLVVAEGTATDTFLAAHPPVSFPSLEKLPKGQQAYFGMSSTQDMVKWGLNLTQQMLGPGAKPTDLTPLLEKMAESRIDSVSGSFSINDQITSISVIDGELKPSYKEAVREMNQQFQTIETPLFKQTVTVEVDAEKVGELPVDVVTVTQEFEGDQAQLQKQVQEKLFGPEGMQTRVIYQPQQVVQVLGDLAQLERALKGLQGDRKNGFAELRGQLPEQANALALINLPMFYGEILKLLAQVDGFPLQFDPAIVDNLNLGQRYVGFAVVSESHAGRLRVEVPIAQIQGIAKLGTAVVMAVQQQQQQGN